MSCIFRKTCRRDDGHRRRAGDSHNADCRLLRQTVGKTPVNVHRRCRRLLLCGYGARAGNVAGFSAVAERDLSYSWRDWHALFSQDLMPKSVGSATTLHTNGLPASAADHCRLVGGNRRRIWNCHAVRLLVMIVATMFCPARIKDALTCKADTFYLRHISAQFILCAMRSCTVIHCLFLNTIFCKRPPT